MAGDEDPTPKGATAAGPSKSPPRKAASKAARKGAVIADPLEGVVPGGSDDEEDVENNDLPEAAVIGTYAIYIYIYVYLSIYLFI
jgi:hypothetical protein